MSAVIFNRARKHPNFKGVRLTISKDGMDKLVSSLEDSVEKLLNLSLSIRQTCSKEGSTIRPQDIDVAIQASYPLARYNMLTKSMAEPLINGSTAKSFFKAINKTMHVHTVELEILRTFVTNYALQLLSLARDAAQETKKTNGIDEAIATEAHARIHASA